MWNVKILKVSRFGTGVEITYQLSNAQDIHTFTAVGNSRDSLEKAISQRVADLERADALIQNLQNIIGDYVPAPIESPTDNRSQAEKDFDADVRLLMDVTNAVNNKVLLDTDTQVTNLRSKVRTALLSNPSWIKYF